MAVTYSPAEPVSLQQPQGLRRAAQTSATAGVLAGLFVLGIACLESTGVYGVLTGLSLLLAGVGLGFAAGGPARISRVLGAVAMLAAGSGAIVVRDAGSGRIAAVAGAMLVLLGGAVMLLDVELRGARWRPAELLAFPTVVVSTGLLAGAFWRPAASGALNEVFLGCAIVASGVLGARPERGWTAVLAGDGAGGIAARGLLGGTVVAALAGALVLGIARRLQVGSESSLALAVTGTLGCASVFALVLARRIDGLDSTRQDRERSLRELAEELAVRRRVEGELRENEVRLLAAQELAQVGSWSWDRDSATVFWSKELARILGQEPKAGGGPLDAFLEPVHPDDRQRVRRLLENAQRDGKRFRCEYRVEIGGRVCNVVSHARPVFGPTGQVARLEGVAQDVTEHREEEEVFRYRDVLEQKFAAALGSLWLAYQPIVEWSQKRVFAWEALMRSDEPVMRNPSVLLRAAEKLGKIQEIGEHVRSHAAEGMPPEPEALTFVNLHVHDLLDDSLYRTDTPFAAVAKSVVLEITERGGLEEIKDVRPRIAMLRQLGFRLAIDDLGAGYSGLITFAQLEPDFVKLDMSLVRDIHRDLTKRRLVQGIAALCKRMGIRLVAEGIETVEERDVLVDLGCDLLQGYLFAMPGKKFPAVTW